MRRPLIAGTLSVVAAGVVAAGCGGGDDDTTTQAETTGGSETTGATTEIKLGDFFFDPKDATAKAGSVTISAPNEGKVEHELVLFKTNMDPAKLPTEAGGEVDEEKLDKEAEEIGEIADVEPGDTKSAQFDLKPGTYVMFCNLPGHYSQGMYGSLKVTG
jgi:uncharacterized cupredoxin-like copper-binding protein